MERTHNARDRVLHAACRLFVEETIQLQLRFHSAVTSIFGASERQFSSDDLERIEQIAIAVREVSDDPAEFLHEYFDRTVPRGHHHWPVAEAIIAWVKAWANNEPKEPAQ